LTLSLRSCLISVIGIKLEILSLWYWATSTLTHLLLSVSHPLYSKSTFATQKNPVTVSPCITHVMSYLVSAKMLISLPLKFPLEMYILYPRITLNFSNTTSSLLSNTEVIYSSTSNSGDIFPLQKAEEHVFFQNIRWIFAVAHPLLPLKYGIR
jgi:hypothetical protein